MRICLLFVFILLQQILWSQCEGLVNAGPDIVLCAPGSAQLNGIIGGLPIQFQWTGPGGYSNTTNLTPSVTVNQTSTYKLTGIFEDPSSPNLITNGDFEAGNSSFTSQYNFVAAPGPMALWIEGRYTVADNPNAYHMNFSTCTDHTSGSGNMMIVNGASSLSKVWCQNIVVNANTYYVFDAWATSVQPTNPARLQFSINNTLIGSIFNLVNTPCLWQNFHTSWFSGAQTNVQICVTNQNTVLSGNDFALDDIAFYEACVGEDSVRVEIVDFVPEITGPDILSCENSVGTISTFVDYPGNLTYDWSSTLNDFTIASPSTIDIQSPDTYYVTVTDENQCSEVASYTVDGDFEIPDLTLTPSDSLDCIINTVTIVNTNPFANYTYSWSGPTGFTSNEAQPEVNVPGLYVATVTNGQNGCKDTLDVTVIRNSGLALPAIIQLGKLTCKDSVALLKPSFYNPTFTYVWSGANTTALDSGAVKITQPGTYQLTITDQNGCSGNQSVTIAPTKPLISSIDTTQGTISCYIDSVRLNPVVIGQIKSINWKGPDSFFSSASIPWVDIPGQYFVSALDSNNCIIRDTVLVKSNREVVLPNFATTDINCIDFRGTFTVFNQDSLKSAFSLTENKAIIANISNITTVVGAHMIEITALNGCKDTLALIVNRDQDYPQISVVKNDIDCNQNLANISVSSNLPDVTYQWTLPDSSNTTGSKVSYPQGGKYYVSSTSSKGCVTLDSIAILTDTIAPKITIQSQLVTCSQPTSILTIQNISGIVQNMVWNGPGLSDFSGQPPFINEGTYSINLTGTNGCKTSMTHQVNGDFRLPTAQILGLNELNCIRKEINLSIETSSVIDQVEWKIGLNTLTTPTAKITSPGIIVVKGVHPVTGCPDTFHIHVKQNITKPQMSLSGDSTINCKMPQVNKLCSVVAPGQILKWLSPTGQNLGSTTSLMANVDGAYKVLSIHPVSQCLDSIRFVIKGDFVKPIITLTADTITCVKTQATINVTSDPNGSISWMGNDVALVTGKYVTTIAGIKTATATAQNGCTQQGQITIVENKTKPQSTVTHNDIDCTNEPAFIKPILFEKDLARLIGNALSMNLTDSVFVQNAGDYQIVFTHPESGCTVSETINIQKLDNGPKGINFALPFSCETHSEQFVFEGLDFAQNGGFTVSLNNKVITKFDGLTVDTGMHNLVITDSKGCQVDTVFFIAKYEIPSVKIEGVTDINFTDDTQLTTTTNLRPDEISEIQWIPSTYLSCDDCLNPTCTPIDDISYKVIITDKNGCTTSNEIEIRVRFDANIYFPNIIRAGSSSNGQFYPLTNASIKSIDALYIYDRWGNLVFSNENFSPNDPQHGWDGNFNGRDMVQGVYTYICKATDIKDNKHTVASDVTVVE